MHHIAAAAVSAALSSTYTKPTVFGRVPLSYSGSAGNVSLGSRKSSKHRQATRIVAFFDSASRVSVRHTRPRLGESGGVECLRLSSTRCHSRPRKALKHTRSSPMSANTPKTRTPRALRLARTLLTLTAITAVTLIITQFDAMSPEHWLRLTTAIAVISTTVLFAVVQANKEVTA